MLNFCLFVKALKPLSLRALRQQAKIQKNSRIFVNLRKFFRILPKIQHFEFFGISLKFNKNSTLFGKKLKFSLILAFFRFIPPHHHRKFRL